MNKVKALKQEILKIIGQSYLDIELAHAKSTLKYVLKLKPNAGQALQIAALAHDIERGLYTKKSQQTKENFTNYIKYKKIHSRRSAKVVGKLLKKYKFNKNLTNKIKHLILLHEFGGNPEANILRDADSISYFRENLSFYYKRWGQKKTIKKIQFMFNRCTPKSQEMIKRLKIKDSKLQNIFKNTIK